MREENEKRVFCNDMVLLCDELRGVYVHRTWKREGELYTI